MVSILMTKDVFEPSYNDSKFIWKVISLQLIKINEKNK